MSDDILLKQTIAEMYEMMGKTCKKSSAVINRNLDSYNINEAKVGYEAIVGNDKYQLVLELKKVE